MYKIITVGICSRDLEMSFFWTVPAKITLSNEYTELLPLAFYIPPPPPDPPPPLEEEGNLIWFIQFRYLDMAFTLIFLNYLSI